VFDTFQQSDCLLGKSAGFGGAELIELHHLPRRPQLNSFASLKFNGVNSARFAPLEIRFLTGLPALPKLGERPRAALASAVAQGGLMHVVHGAIEKSQTRYESFILIMITDPEPKHLIFLQVANSPITFCDTHRPKRFIFERFFKKQTWMRRVARPY